MSQYALLTLPDIQNQCKRDPDAYRDEFMSQYRHFESQLSIYRLKPATTSSDFVDIVYFVSQLAHLYKNETAAFPGMLMDLLDENYEQLTPAPRMKMVQALILLRKKGIVDAVTVLPLFFKLFRCPDKALRTLVYHTIVSDIKALNDKKKDHRLNSTLQNFMFKMVHDDSSVAAKKSLDVIIDLYRSNIWTDTKTVNVVASACLSKNSKVSSGAVQFFLGIDERMIQEEEDGVTRKAGGSAAQQKVDALTTSRNKKKRSTKKLMERSKKLAAKAKKEAMESTVKPRFLAMEMIHDPTGLAEKLFGMLKGKADTFEIRLMTIHLISRLIQVHKIILLQFYTFLQGYLQPHQQHVTMVLAYLCMAIHEHIPPEVVEPIVKALVDRFVSDKCRNEVMAIGINSVREVCARQPLVMTEELLQDLAQYTSIKDKGVVVAARSLIALFREIMPSMLIKKDRGKDHDMTNKLKTFGTVHAPDRLEAGELLEARAKEKKEAKAQAKELADGEEADGDDSASFDSEDENGMQGLPAGFKMVSKKRIKDVGPDEADDEDEDEDEDDSEDDDDGNMMFGEEGEEGEEEEEEDDEEIEEEEDMRKRMMLMDTKEIRVECENLDLANNGKKHVMIDRIVVELLKRQEEAFAGESDDDDDEDEDDVEDDESEEEEAPKSAGKALAAKKKAAQKKADAASDAKKLAKKDAKKMEEEEEEEAATGVPMEMTKIFTDEDWERIDRLKRKKAAGKKRGADEMSDSEEDSDASDDSNMGIHQHNPLRNGVLDGTDIEGFKARKKRTLEERLATMKEGRDERPLFGAKAKKRTKGGGSTNLAKLKNKPVMMAIKSKAVRVKKHRSMKEKQSRASGPHKYSAMGKQQGGKIKKSK